MFLRKNSSSLKCECIVRHIITGIIKHTHTCIHNSKISFWQFWCWYCIFTLHRYPLLWVWFNSHCTSNAKLLFNTSWVWPNRSGMVILSLITAVLIKVALLPVSNQHVPSRKRNRNFYSKSQVLWMFVDLLIKQPLLRPWTKDGQFLTARYQNNSELLPLKLLRTTSFSCINPMIRTKKSLSG